MDISGLGEKLVARLCDLGYLKDIADIYDLHQKKQHLYQLDGLGEQSISNLLTAIEDSKKQPFHKVLFSIGIKMVGEKTAKVLARHFHNIDNLSNASVNDIANIYEIGKVIAISVHNTLKDDSMVSVIHRLMQKGLKFESDQCSVTSTKLNGLTFVFTGELSKMTRTEAANIVEQLGAKETKSVSKKTSFVVAGDSPGSKYEKALLLGIKILNEKEFLELIDVKQ